MRKPLSPADETLERLRHICKAFPGAEEKLSHGAPSFHVRGRMFVMFVDDHHADGRLAVWCKAEKDDQRRMVAVDPARFFVPPYVGVSGWIGVRLDRPDADWIELAILLEHGYAAVAPKRIAETVARQPPRPPPPEPARTDAVRVQKALARLTEICLALPEAAVDKKGRHATFSVGRKAFAYLLDNHHGDGHIGVCVRMPKSEARALADSAPKRFFIPAYIGARGWVGIAAEGARVDWRDVAVRVLASYRVVAPVRLQRALGPRTRA